MTPRVLGIAGGSASGKTTLTRAVTDVLGERALTLLHDRYYRSLPPGRHPLDYNFDHPDALDTERMVRDLQSLRAGRRTSVPVYDFAKHLRAPDEEWIAPRPIILVEGILVLHSAALRHEMDVKIYVWADEATRLRRRIERDVAKRGRTPYDVMRQYEKTVRPMHNKFVAPSKQYAQLELDGTAELAGLVRQVLKLAG